jgi:iron complex outermembrane receptor protein
MRNTAAVVGCCLSVLVGQCASSALAEDQSSENKAVLEEIVVSAQKREENLQNVPISVQAISGQYLADQNFNSFDELAQILPGVHIGNGGGNNFSNDLYIRGIGSGAGSPQGNPSLDQSVAIFADDIFNGRSRTSGATFLDLDRIEVLKGPQSTFFGNNAIAGALNVVSKKPGDELEGYTRLLYGMHDQYAAEGAVTLPVNDQLSVRAAAIFDGTGGWIKNVTTGKDAPDENNKAGRLTFNYKPTDNLDALWKFEASDNRTSGSQGGQPSQIVNCPPPPPFTAAGVGGVAGVGSCAQVLAMGLPVGLDNDENEGLAGQGSTLSTFDSVLTLNYHQWDHTFTSVTGFTNYHFSQTSAELFPTYLFNAQQAEKYNQFSQEFRISSPAGQTIQYMVGAYFQTDHIDESLDINAPVFDFLTQALPPLFPLQPYTPLAFNPTYSQGEHVYSLFGAATWNVTDTLKINAGLRGTEDNKDFTGSLHYGTSTQLYGGFTSIPANLEPLWSILEGAPGTQAFNRSDHAWMPSAGIQYQIEPQAMLYFTYSNGFKAGGFNGILPNAVPSNVIFGPEHVNAFELGVKSKWLDDRVLVNLDLFLGNYRDLQATAVSVNPIGNTISIFVRNAAESRSQGAELETQWAVTKDFRLAANVTFLDSYYVSYTNASQTTLQGFCAQSAANYANPQCAIFPNPVPPYANISGEPTNFAPRWSGSIMASYGLDLPGGYKFITELSPYFTSSYNEQDPYILGTPGYMRLDGRLTLAMPGGRWDVDLIGKNLTNRIIISSSATGASKEEPLNVALQMRYRF